MKKKLVNYSKSAYYPFHMPGHKRQYDFGIRSQEIDITEISGFDNLHHAEGILKEAQERMAEVFRSEKSYYLINGSTAGILSAISACTQKGDAILMARNCHKAVYHAVALRDLKPIYIYPEVTKPGIQGSISPLEIERILKKEQVRAVVITSPTYDGVVSDIKAIAKLVHRYKIPLIVDEAHGAHFGFGASDFSKAHWLGADLVIESLHKTLPSYTQTAALHIGNSNFVDKDRTAYYLQVYQTSSPSYLLMSGIEDCVEFAASSAEEFNVFYHRLHQFYKEHAGLDRIRLYPYSKEKGIFQRDPSKILISATQIGWTGHRLSEEFRQNYYLEMEMETMDTVTALTSVCDTQEGFDRLSKAIREMDLRRGSAIVPMNASDLYRKTDQRYLPGEVVDRRGETVSLSESKNRISSDFIYLYPPGIPLLVPGEQITEEITEILFRCVHSGIEVIGLENGKVRVIGNSF